MKSLREIVQDCRLINRFISWRLKFLLYLYGGYLYDPVRKKLRTDLVKSSALIERGKKCQTASQDFEDVGLLPKMHPIGRAYQILTNATLVLMFIKLSIVFLDPANKLPITYYLRCYTPRFALIPELDRRFGPILSYILCVNHLLWRWAVMIYEGEFSLDLVPFLLAKQSLIEERIRLGGHRLALREQQQQANKQPPPDILDASMFLKLGDQFTLRPNRTLAARTQLINTINLYFNCSMITVFLIGITTISVGLYTLTFRQDELYINCGAARPELWTVILIYRLISCAIVSLVYFFDAMVAIFWATISGYLFSVDLLMYWRSIRRRIDATYRESLMALREQRTTAVSDEEIVELEDWTLANYLQPAIPLIHRRSASDKNLVDLKSILIDFFAQLKRVDRFVSILIPMAFAAWLSCNFVVTLCGFQLSTNANEELLAIRLYQTLGILAATGLSGLILRLIRNTQPAYPVLCSIVAMERSLNKRLWIRLLDVYTHRPQYAFTFLHGRIFTQLTFLKFISYTLTITLLIQTMHTSR